MLLQLIDTIPMRGTCLVLGVAQVRLDHTDIAELLLRVFGGDGRGNNDIVPDIPIDGGRDALLVGCLQGINHAQDLRGVAASRRGIQHGETNLLGGVNDKDGADGKGNALLGKVVQVLLGNHVVEEGNLAVSIGDDGELEVRVGDFIDILNPLVVRAEVVGALQGCMISMQCSRHGKGL